MEDKSFKWMNRVIGVQLLAYLILGIASIVLHQDFYAVYLSLFCVAGVFLMIFQGVPMLGARNMVMFYLDGVLVSFFFEASGANYGWFFSKYTYTEVMLIGPQIWGVSFLPFLAYGALPYVIFAMAQAIVGQYDNVFRKGDVLLIPAVGAFLMTAIDFATDPLMASMGGSHLWEEHGVFYGIPIQNYIGWYLFAFVMLLIPSVILWYQYRGGRLPARPEASRRKRFWLYPTFIYGLLFVQHLFYIFNGDDRTVVTYNGSELLTRDIYQGTALISFATLVGYSLFACVKVCREDKLTK